MDLDADVGLAELQVTGDCGGGDWPGDIYLTLNAELPDGRRELTDSQRWYSIKFSDEDDVDR